MMWYTMRPPLDGVSILQQLPPGVQALVLAFCDGGRAFTLWGCRPYYLDEAAVVPRWRLEIAGFRSERRRRMDEGDLTVDYADSSWPAALGDVDDDPPLVDVDVFFSGEADRAASLLSLHVAALRRLLARLDGTSSDDDDDDGPLYLALPVLFGGGAALPVLLWRVPRSASSLSLGGCGGWVDDALVARFARRRPPLRSLDLHSCELLTPAALAAIARHCGGTLEYLCLSHCRGAVSDEGARLLAKGIEAHGPTPRLAHLSLAGAVRLSDAGIRDLARHLRHAPLVDLSLSGCHRLTDKSMAHVALDFIFLRRFNYCGAYRVTADGFRGLMNQQPGVLTYNNARAFGQLYGADAPASPGELARLYAGGPSYRGAPSS